MLSVSYFEAVYSVPFNTILYFYYEPKNCVRYICKRIVFINRLVSVLWYNAQGVCVPFNWFLEYILGTLTPKDGAVAPKHV